MVTAAAPALPDSHAFPQAAAGTASSAARPSTSFQSVYQSLPLLPGDSVNQLENSKTAASKKTSSKNPDDTLPAPVNFTAAAPPPQRPWTAQPSFSVKTSGSAAESEPATREAPEFSMSGQSLSTPGLAEKASDIRRSSLSSAAVATARNASAAEPEPNAREVAQLSMSEQSAPAPAAAVRASNMREYPLPASTPEPSSNLIRPALAAGTVNPDSAPAAAAGIVASARQLVASREPAFNLQAPISAPAYLLGTPSAPQVSQLELSPEPRQPANSPRSSQPSASAQPSVDPALFTKGLAAALAPQNGNLAFSLKMMESTLQARHAQQVVQPRITDRNQAGTEAKSDEHNPLALLAPNAPHATTSPASAAAIPGDVAAAAATVSPVWNEAAAAAQWNTRPDTQLPEPHQSVNLSTVAALHDAQPILPEAPRSSAASEILLQLGGKDQAAAIRVTDRAGAVNVSVHATDPDLRSSLRSNLGDLATQLTHQGWKTEVVKTGTTLTRGETSQDPQQNGQRSPGQQQPSSQGERQPPRDRRASSGQWLAAFEEQASGNSGNPGGTNS